jgi:hypothetical protein
MPSESSYSAYTRQRSTVGSLDASRVTVGLRNREPTVAVSLLLQIPLPVGCVRAGWLQSLLILPSPPMAVGSHDTKTSLLSNLLLA